MILRGIVLQNFRSYQNAHFEFGKGVNVIVGKNGSGKSNLLESIFFLSSGKSFRATSLKQMIFWQAKYGVVAGKIEDENGEKRLETQLITNETGGCSRKFLVNGIQKPRFKYLDEMRCVLFDPEDIRLICGSPSRRRDFLDTIFSTNEWTYAQALSQYNKALKHRNELLDLIRTGKSRRSELYYWDQSLLKNSTIIHNYRLKFASSVNDFWVKHNNAEIRKMAIKYLPSVIPMEKSDEEINMEINSGFTRRGPHRDDFLIESQLFNNNDKNIAFWGSRGQQRLAVLALRLGQINYFAECYLEKPILLLDDIFSELDDNHRKIVVEICDKYQVIYTTAEEETLKYLPTAQIQKI